LDSNASPDARRKAAQSLARLGSDAALAALRTGLSQAPSDVKADIAEALGECRHPEAATLLLELTRDADEIVACGAVRGLAAGNDAPAAGLLEQLLQDVWSPVSVRTEACLALGDVTHPDALSALIRAANDGRDETIAEYALEGLGKRPFAETESFFREFLETPGRSSQAKTAALEALAGGEEEVAPLLLASLRDSDPEVRAAAAWALTTADTPPETGSRLLELLQTETSSTVRVRLYQALTGQQTYDAAAVPGVVQKESDPDARLAGFGLWAAACNAGKSPELLANFESLAVPELGRTALSAESPQQRMSAVTALGLVKSPQTLATLQNLSQNATDPRVVDAAKAALQAPR
jgi:HEAT repeat protein